MTSINYPAQLIRPNRGFVLPSPFMLMGGVALAFGITTLMFYNLWRASANEFSTYVATVEATNAKIAQENAKRLAEAKQATTDVANDHAVAMGVLAKSYNSRLNGLQRACGSSATRTIASSATGTNGFTSDNRLIESGVITTQDAAAAFEEAANRLEKDAAVTTVKLVYLQDWVDRVCK